MSSKNNSALASITAQYTDSENEDGHSDSDESERSDISKESQVRPTCRRVIDTNLSMLLIFP